MTPQVVTSLIYLVGLLALLASGLYALTYVTRPKHTSLERLWSVIQSWFHVGNGGTVTTATVAGLLLGEPVSTQRLAIYSGTLVLGTSTCIYLLSRSHRGAQVRQQVERANPATGELARLLKALPSLYTSIAELQETASLLKSDAGKNTQTERSTRTSRSSLRKKLDETGPSSNGQRDIADYELANEK